MKVRRNGEESDHGRDCRQDGAQPEVPTPGHVLGSYTSKEDSYEEPQRRTRAVDAENHILTGPWTICAAEQHESARQERRGTKALEGTAEDDHQLVAGKPSDDAPDGNPCVAGYVNGEATVHVSQSSKGKQKGGDRKRECVGRPRAC